MKTDKSKSGASERTIVRHKHDLGYIILSSLVKEISINTKRYINTIGTATITGSNYFMTEMSIMNAIKFERRRYLA